MMFTPPAKEKPIDPEVPLRAQKVQEGSYVRVHYRLRCGVPGQGRAECFSFVEGRCSYGTRCLFSHDTARICCNVCGSEHHVPEECIYYGGGNYDPQQDPNALKEAERAAARNRTPPFRLRPTEPSHPPPKSVLKKYPPWSRWDSKQVNIWYGTDYDEPEEWVEEEPVRTRRAKPPSPPKVLRTGARLRPRADGSGKRPPTPPRSKRVRPATSSSACQPPPPATPSRRREPKRRQEPQVVPASIKIEGINQKTEVRSLVPKGSVGRSTQPAPAPRKRKAAKAPNLSKRSRSASAKKVKEVVESVELPSKYLQPT